jgi:hypothetical protein
MLSALCLCSDDRGRTPLHLLCTGLISDTAVAAVADASEDTTAIAGADADSAAIPTATTAATATATATEGTDSSVREHDDPRESLKFPDDSDDTRDGSIGFTGDLSYSTINISTLGYTKRAVDSSDLNKESPKASESASTPSLKSTSSAPPESETTSSDDALYQRLVWLLKHMGSRVDLKDSRGATAMHRYSTVVRIIVSIIIVPRKLHPV